MRAPSCSLRSDVGTDMKLMAASRSFVNAPNSSGPVAPPAPLPKSL